MCVYVYVYIYIYIYIYDDSCDLNGLRSKHVHTLMRDGTGGMSQSARLRACVCVRKCLCSQVSAHASTSECLRARASAGVTCGRFSHRDLGFLGSDSRSNLMCMGRNPTKDLRKEHLMNTGRILHNTYDSSLSKLQSYGTRIRRTHACALPFRHRLNG